MIACGLAILVVNSTCWPAAPAVTACALVACGATRVTIERFRGTPALAPMLFVHLVVYAGLYAIFVGATLHAAARADAGSVVPTAIDLAASLLPVAGVLCIVSDALRGTRLAE
jgi:hypothetical protein